MKWAALTLEYIQLEKELLPAALMEKPLDGITYDEAFARGTAAGVVATRIQNLVITLDKIKYVLRQPGQCQAPFLRPLTDAEVVSHLWDGPNGGDGLGFRGLSSFDTRGSKKARGHQKNS